MGDVFELGPDGLVFTGGVTVVLHVDNPAGRYLSGNPRLAVMLGSAWTNRFTDKSASFAFARETKEELLALKDMIEEQKIESIVDRIYPMEEAADAHRRVETEQRLGAIVIAIGDCVEIFPAA